MDKFNPVDFKKLLEAAQDELVKLLREKETIQWKIAKLQNDIVHLAALANEPVEDPILQLGFTDIIRSVFSRSAKPLSYSEIADSMKAIGYDTSGYKNIAANIHTVVQRLLRAKEIVNANQRGRFQWAGGPPPSAPPPSWLKERIEKARSAGEPLPQQSNQKEVL